MEPDIRTFMGRGPLINASGCLCATKKMLAQLETSSATGICTKTATLAARAGNPEPRYWEDRETGMTLNSMGLPNLGLDYYLDYFAGLETDKWRCLSLLPEDIVCQLAKIQGAAIDAVEWNMSCPNLVGKKILAYDVDGMAALLTRIGAAIASIPSAHPAKHGIKLPPYYEPEVIAEIVTKCLLPNPWISFIHLVNSVPNALIIDPVTDTTVIHPKEGHGGLGGPCIKPIALANVHRFYLELKKHSGHPVDIIGCGGISTGQDVYEFILAGASAVSIGSQLMMEGAECFARIERELKNRMEAKGVLSLDQIRGRLNIRGPD